MEEYKRVITFKDIYSILQKHKKKFALTFLTVVIVGLVLTFIRPPIYSVETTVMLSDNYKYYDKFLLENFTDESKNLWLYRESEIGVSENDILDNISNEIKSTEFTQKLKSQLSFDISLEELKKSIMPYRVKDRTLNIKVVYNNEQKAYEILQKTVNLLKNNKREELAVAYSKMIKEIEGEVERSDANLDHLIAARENLIKNKDLFVDRIKFEENFDIYTYANRAKDITITLSSGIFLGLIVSFSKYYFDLLKSD